MARSLDDSPTQPSPCRDSPRAAPYLTHELTHHGQVTLIPPQNAGRIRKGKQKGDGSATRRVERERGEPRFNTSVPASARRARTTSARIPRQSHSPQVQLAEVRNNRESDIPEYPPPSFQEAILTPPISPDSLAYITPSDGTPYGGAPVSGPQQPQHTHPVHSSFSRTVSPDSVSPRSTQSSESHVPLQRTSDSEPDPSEVENDDLSDPSSSPLITPEPPTQWEADIRSGVPLESRIYRERIRLEAAESTAALVATPRPAIVLTLEETDESAIRSKSRCSRCETLRPLDCATANEMRHPDNDSDEHESSTFRGRVMSPLRMDTASLPCSPLVTGTPVSAPMNPWTSTVTLSSSSMASPSKSSGVLKRKDSVILRKLFGQKGKEPKKPLEPTVKEETFGSWEVVDSEDLHISPAPADRPALDREQSNSSAWTQVAVPTSPVFIKRPVRPFLHAPTSTSPFVSKTSPSRDSPTGSQSSSCEPSPSDNPNQRRKPPPPPPPRRLRSSPSVVWKTSTVNDSPSPPLANPVEPDTSKLPFPSSSSLLSSRSRAASSLSPLTVPRRHVYNEEAGSSTRDDPHSLSASTVPYTSTYATTIASDRSSSPPASPTTPSHHYRGRPLPQPPHEPSPLARPVCRSLSPSPLPRSESHPPSPSPRVPHRRVPQAQQDAEYMNLTELDVLASRLTEGDRTGRNYEELLLLSEFLGPAHPPAHGNPSTSEETAAPFVGRVEVQRRRILRDGRVKLKLLLLGTVVERCGICLSQFKDQELAALCISCRKAYHEHCLRSWLMRSRTCPECRAPLDISS